MKNKELIIVNWYCNKCQEVKPMLIFSKFNMCNNCYEINNTRTASISERTVRLIEKGRVLKKEGKGL